VAHAKVDSAVTEERGEDQQEDQRKANVKNAEVGLRQNALLTNRN
jgi:hypothetical protein